jgi:hypothetical protein
MPAERKADDSLEKIFFLYMAIPLAFCPEKNPYNTSPILGKYHTYNFFIITLNNAEYMSQ